MEHLLEVKNLSVSIDGPAGEVQAVRDVSFSLKKGEVLAIVGESGCGKSVLCKSIMKLLPPSAKIKEGSICVNGQDITCYREKEMQKLRGKVFSRNERGRSAGFYLYLLPVYVRYLSLYVCNGQTARSDEKCGGGLCIHVCL